MSSTQKFSVSGIGSGNACAASVATWWIRGISRDRADVAAALDKIRQAISLIREIDGISIDITITINNTSQP